jgi:opacity protein-like surface antigen
MPTTHFTYSSGTFPDGTTATSGDDVTTQVETAFAFTPPQAANAFMFTLGGGVEVPVSRHWAVAADYRFNRVAADTPLNAHGASFGFGYRF